MLRLLSELQRASSGLGDFTVNALVFFSSFDMLSSVDPPFRKISVLAIFDGELPFTRKDPV